MGQPPQNTPEERQRALEAALEARRERSEIKHEVRTGDLAVADVLERGRRGATDELGAHARVYGRIEIGDLLMAAYEIGPKRAAKILDAAQVAPDQHLDTLSEAERSTIIEELS